MANQEQLKTLEQGVLAWNKWRRENPNIEIDLSEAKLSQAVLFGVDLSFANLWGTDFSGADLTNANLHGADLSESDLTNADLMAAHCLRANFTKANFSKSNLREVSFLKVNLSEANLTESIFMQSKLDLATLGSIDLSNAIGLETVYHLGPSTLGTNTLSLSKGKIPKVFLRGCGLSDWEIESVKLFDPHLSNEEINEILYNMYDLRAGQALQISPLFISYSHADDGFVDKLEGYLDKAGIRFWRDIHDAKAGRLEKQIARAIRFNPTVLLILSKHSLRSDWVEHEVRTARELEKELGRDVLCPVALDGSWKKSPWPKRVMEQVTEYNILDFSNWIDDGMFSITFNKLIDGLELFYKG